MAYHLISINQDKIILTLQEFDPKILKEEIIKHLKQNPTDTIQYCKDLTEEEAKKFTGYNNIDFYEVNPKNNKVSKVITKGNKEFFKNIEDD